MTRSFNINKALLVKLYIKQHKTLQEIGEVLKCSPSTVYKYLHWYKISARRQGKQKLNLDRKALYDLYVRQKKSTCQIARKYNCTRQGVWWRLREYGIATRRRWHSPEKALNLDKRLLYDMYIKQGKTMEGISRTIKCSCSTVQRYLTQYDIPKRKRAPKALSLDRDLLYDLYIKQEKSMQKTGKALGCSAQSVCRYLCKYNIPARRQRRVKRAQGNEDQ